ncbi:MAG: metal-binding protein [Lachnospiraceae bacterium]|nr:metal-binding protein [Lachnospiraceae bacterium]
MDNSSRFFENRSCEYFPCHEGLENFNCLFCYCPMYWFKECLGDPKFIKTKEGKIIKACTDCTFPHVPEHYDAVMEFIADKIKGQERQGSLS